MSDSTDRFSIWKRGTRPEALKKDETMRLFREYRKYGDEETREKLIYGSLGLVAKYVTTYGIYKYKCNENSYPTVDDLLSIGEVTLMKAVDTFDPDQYKFAFSTYLFHHIDRDIRAHLFEGASINAGVRFDANITDNNNPDEEASTLLELTADKSTLPEKMFDVLDIKMIEKEILPLLPKRERDIFYAMKFEGKTEYFLADRYNITRQRVNQIVKSATEKVLRLYNDGVSDIDYETRGIDFDGKLLEYLKENKEIVSTYGRSFLVNYFLPALSEEEQRIFSAFVLNYRGQTLEQIIKENDLGRSTRVHYVLKTIKKKLGLMAPELKVQQKKDRLNKAPTLKQQQKINQNERFLNKFGGKFFLQRYFVPSLAPLDSKIFQLSMEYDGQPVREMAKKVGLTEAQFNTRVKKIYSDLKLVDFDALVSLVDNQKTLMFNIAKEHRRENTEREFDIEEVSKRQEVMKRFGGVDRIVQYFLPVLSKDEADVFKLLYLNPTFSTFEGLATYLDKSVAQVIATDKIVMAKLESTNFDELEKLSLDVDDYLKNTYSSKSADATHRKYADKILSNFGGEVFIREEFLPMMSSQLDREILGRYILDGEPIEKLFPILPKIRRFSGTYIDGERTPKQCADFIHGRLNYSIISQLQKMKEDYINFEEAVKDFYVRKGFDKSHSENIQKVAFGVEESKQEAENYFPDELIQKIGGEKVALKKFLTTMKISEQLVFFKSRFEKKDDITIAAETDLKLEEVEDAKRSASQKLHQFADALGEKKNERTGMPSKMRLSNHGSKEKK